MSNPLLLTLTLNAEAQIYFNDLRKKYFPAERNVLDAHLMLFHQLPANDSSVVNDIQSLASKTGILTLEATAIKSIGNGVAFKIESDELQQIHKDLQKRWSVFIIPQDKNKLWPHVTIQNKVQPKVAQELLAELNADFKPFSIQGTGFTLWEYLAGPWQFKQQFDFSE
ncbi:2'-5' RNA ligase family protein [Mucilaginibacter pallidiroseus]|nr:2'-5' RNA ligase family protein [Mucilaginibacter pallidiroseus]